MKHEEASELGLKIRIKMIEQNIKGVELCNKIGISPQYLSAILNGRVKNPSIQLMRKFSELLNTPVEELFFS